MKMFYRAFIFLLLVVLTGCQTVTVHNPDDPLESINRPVEMVNANLDFWVLTPTSFVYRSLVPAFLRHGIHRMFLNAGEISNAVNAGLQGNWPDFENSIERFSINTSCGFFGFFDRAIETGRVRTPHDFGQTLYNWGYTESTFVMIPLLGPSTIRDSFSLFFDRTLLNPPMYLSSVNERSIALGSQILDAKSSAAEKFEDIKPPTYFDRYLIIKDSYLQNREYYLNPPTWDDYYNLDY